MEHNTHLGRVCWLIRHALSVVEEVHLFQEELGTDQQTDRKPRKALLLEQPRFIIGELYGGKIIHDVNIRKIRVFVCHDVRGETSICEPLLHIIKSRAASSNKAWLVRRERNQSFHRKAATYPSLSVTKRLIK